MLARTHLAIGSAVMLAFLPHVAHKLIFIPVILLASLLPDIDSASSHMGHSGFLRPLQWMTKHRGIIHSMTLCIIFSFVFAFYIPVLALPFFLGYSAHLFSDAFTQDGIMPFWPYKKESRGFLRTGGKREYALFVVFLGINVILFIGLFI